MVGQLGSKWLVMTQIGHIISAQAEKSGPEMAQFWDFSKMAISEF